MAVNYGARCRGCSKCSALNRRPSAPSRRARSATSLMVRSAGLGVALKVTPPLPSARAADHHAFECCEPFTGSAVPFVGCHVANAKAFVTFGWWFWPPLWVGCRGKRGTGAPCRPRSGGQTDTGTRSRRRAGAGEHAGRAPQLQCRLGSDQARHDRGGGLAQDVLVPGLGERVCRRGGCRDAQEPGVEQRRARRDDHTGRGGGAGGAGPGAADRLDHGAGADRGCTLQPRPVTRGHLHLHCHRPAQKPGRRRPAGGRRGSRGGHGACCREQRAQGPALRCRERPAGPVHGAGCQGDLPCKHFSHVAVGRSESHIRPSSAHPAWLWSNTRMSEPSRRSACTLWCSTAARVPSRRRGVWDARLRGPHRD